MSPLATRAARVRLIRRRVVAATLATFALAWGVVAVDGSMGSTTTTAHVSTAATDSAATTDDTTTDTPSTVSTQQS